MHRPACLLAAAAMTVVVAACGDDEESTPATVATTATAVSSGPTGMTSTTTGTTSTTVTSTTVTSTTVTSTSVTSTSTSTAPTPRISTTAPRQPCREPFTSTDAVSDGFPERLSSLVGAAIRTGAHPCFERVVLELQGAGELPGYRVQYVDDPVHLSPSDETVEITGDATLLLQAGVWMTTMEGVGYQGPTEIVPPNVEHVLELRMVENFEGMTAWAIGLDALRPFEVDTLTDPPRIVVDVWTGDAG